jgi:parvulin-like peptidyl-prolyl isomerase
MHHEDLREGEVANLFGGQFSREIKQAKIGDWTGPVESGYGAHLVKVHQRVAGRLPELDEVRDVVRREWFAARRAESKEQFYDRLRDRYEVVVEMPTPEESSEAAAGGAAEKGQVQSNDAEGGAR